MQSMKKKLFCVIVVLALCLSAVPVQAAGESRAEPVTRQMVSTALWEMEGAPVVNDILPFTDVSEKADYAEAVRWAASEKIVSGVGGGLFLPDGAVSREQLAAMIYRYAQKQGQGFIGLWAFNMGNYSDAGDVSDWAFEAVAWCVMNGVIFSDESGNLNPAGTVTEEQLTGSLERFSLSMVPEDAPLSLWAGDARAKTELVSYMKAITDASGPDYIPAEDRIAVFDLDGTLFCETDPNYFDYTLLKYRVLEDPSYKDKASDFEKEVANKIKEQNETGKSFSGLEVDHGRAVASAFAGMTVAEFNAYIQEFKKQPMPSYDGMLRGEGWYLPMLEIVEYLKANDFTVYVVSGTDRLIVRGIAYDSPLGLPNRQIIGSDELIVSSNQGDTDGLDYVFKDGDELILGGEFLIKNLKMNKVSVIMQEIGQQPVLSFGNSTGDSSMAEYVTYHNQYKSLAFMLCCDDLVRENGSESKAQMMFDLCEEFDWVSISMKNDWTTIYGDGVTHK